ncbi:hypothetical protein L1987_59368 [Smallanthus sonchifolius]|uniref:Uncharacterized protein n=1 Tax=Smallanthus sonchifolius TaxID=185202 RepID=A0ACB9D534_9ASTR|nr:hypothetical protein L1987_59368 [Smallanthus sonchifolius]
MAGNRAAAGTHVPPVVAAPAAPKVPILVASSLGNLGGYTGGSSKGKYEGEDIALVSLARGAVITIRAKFPHGSAIGHWKWACYWVAWISVLGLWKPTKDVLRMVFPRLTGCELEVIWAFCMKKAS